MRANMISVASGKWILPAFFCFLVNIFPVQSQETVTVIPDTVKNTIPMVRIPVASGETLIKITKVAESLIKEEQISTLQAENDSLKTIIESLLKEEKGIDYNELNDRYLYNRLNFWIDYKILVEKENSKLSNVIKTLDDQHNTLAKELDLWGNTRNNIQPGEPASSVIVIIDKVTANVDSVNKLIIGKTDQIIQMLSVTTRDEVEIEDRINNINELIQQRQARVFAKTHESFLGINFTDGSNWRLRHHLQLFNENDIFTLNRYYQNNKVLFAYFVVFLVLLIVLFQYFRRKILAFKVDSPSQFEIELREILSKPISAAMILGLFSTVIIFPNRPLIFVDMTVLVASVPLIIIVLTIGKSIKRQYILIFTTLLILRFINFIFPPEILIHRFITLVVGILEVMVFIDLFRFFRKNKIKNNLFHNFVQLLIIVHLVIAAVGIVSNFYGSVSMADLAVNMVITNTFIAFLLFVSVVIVIGLIHFAIDGSYFGRLNFVNKYGPYLKSRTVGLTVFIAVIFWLTTILELLGIYGVVADNIQRILTTEYSIGSATFSLGSTLLFFFIIWLSVMISKIVRVLLEDDVLERITLKKGVPRMISVMTKYTIITIGIFLAVTAAGMPLDSLTIIFGAFSVGIGFGLQNIFNNFVSGLILLFERPIQIGDVIEVGNLIGEVKSMGIRSSNLRTYDGSEVIVPNGHLISNEVVNWTLSDKMRRIEIISGVAYGSDVHKVQGLFLKVLNEHPDVLDNPKPNVYFNDMGESSLDFRLLFWTANFDDWLRIRSEVVFKIHDALYEEGIEIPFPQRDLHIRSVQGHVEIGKGKGTGTESASG